MSILAPLDWSKIRGHYDERYATHQRLVSLHARGPSMDFAVLALGIVDPSGNYSAAEHKLGERVIAENAKVLDRVHALAGTFLTLRSGRKVPELIRAASIKSLAIGVGSEISCMMNPAVCWVANTRTIWTHLAFHHHENIATADEALRLYRSGDASSAMAYKIWTAVHHELEGGLLDVSRLGTRQADTKGVKAGAMPYLWADAISSELYANHHRT